MSYRNARLANGFLSLDQLAGEIDLVKSRTVSERGAGVEGGVGRREQLRGVCRDPGRKGAPGRAAEERAVPGDRARGPRTHVCTRPSAS